jgi:hypothetical protein
MIKTRLLLIFGCAIVSIFNMYPRYPDRLESFVGEFIGYFVINFGITLCIAIFPYFVCKMRKKKFTSIYIWLAFAVTVLLMTILKISMCMHDSC